LWLNLERTLNKRRGKMGVVRRRQLQQPDITFGQSNDRWKRLCLVSWAAVPCVWTLSWGA